MRNVHKDTDIIKMSKAPGPKISNYSTITMMWHPNGNDKMLSWQSILLKQDMLHTTCKLFMVWIMLKG